LRSNNKAGCEALERGVDAHRSGRFEKALLAYKAALSAAPGDAESARLTGLALAHSVGLQKRFPFLIKRLRRSPSRWITGSI